MKLTARHAHFMAILFWSLPRSRRATSTTFEPASIDIPVAPGLRRAWREEVASQGAQASRWQDLAPISRPGMWGMEGAGPGVNVPMCQCRTSPACHRLRGCFQATFIFLLRVDYPTPTTSPQRQGAASLPRPRDTSSAHTPHSLWVQSPTPGSASCPEPPR